jgi:hypothetical protein
VSRTGRGRTRETWARTVTAEVTVVDRRALRDEALRRLDTGIVIGEFADDDPDLTDPRDDVAESFAAAWNWAADPYAPVPPIPGITWAPAGVEVEHILRCPTR